MVPGRGQELHHPDLPTAHGRRGTLGPHEGPLSQNHFSHTLHHCHCGGLREPQEAQPATRAGGLQTLVTRGEREACCPPHCSGLGQRMGGIFSKCPPTQLALPGARCPSGRGMEAELLWLERRPPGSFSLFCQMAPSLSPCTRSCPKETRPPRQPHFTPALPTLCLTLPVSLTS